MVEWGKSKEQTWPAGIAAAGWRAAPDWLRALSRLVQAAGGRIREWALLDVGPGRLIPWLPIAFGFGIVLYFSADQEPAWWAGLTLTAACIVSAFLSRRRPVAFPLLVGIAAIAAGFTMATIKGVHVSHPVLAFPVSGLDLSGYVEVREERERSDRFVLRIHRIDGARSGVTLERVRLYVRKGTAPLVGSFVTLKARLNPPLAQLRPGGYDFARDLYFQRIGASGFVLGAIRDAEPPAPPSLWLRYAAAISMMRDAIDARIRAVVPGDKGAIASALITGKRDAISAPVNEAMYVSSLAHVLSISGYHMAVVAGVIFFTIRAAFALIPAFANRYPIKKWAAGAALAMAAFYLALSGAEVATQRAFIMTAIVLIGVMFDRPALTLRTIAVAALAVMLIAPEAVVHPSFQMSFAATLALIAAYEKGLPWFSAVPETSLGARIALWGGRELLGLVLASMVAGLATTLFAAYHFHRLAPYGVIANLLAMPIVSGWVMPAGLLALIAIPFGFDGPLWRLMGEGIGWMIAVATFVASLPGAVGRIPAFGIGAVLTGTAGLILLCLLRSPLRWAGIPLLALTIALALRAPLPDVLVSSDGRMVAVRGADGRLRVMKTGSDDFAVKDWLAADGDARNSRDATLAEGTRCDNVGCVTRLADGKNLALSLTAEALAEDCARAAIVVSPRNALPGCAALTIDRDVWRKAGATSLKWNGTSFDIVAANPPGYERPWLRSQQRRAQQSTSAAGAPVGRTAPRDATPLIEDIEAGD